MSLTKVTFSMLADAPINLKDFGAVGDGVADDTSALTAFFAASTGKICFLPAGTYRTTSLITTALTNCKFVGVPGQTTIVGAFGYAVLRLLDLDSVVFEDIAFQTNYVNAVEDQSFSVVYIRQANAKNVTFNRCRFSSPDANTTGLTFYINTLSTDTYTCSGLRIIDCDFKDVGRIGCTLMNRSTQTGNYGMFTDTVFSYNRGTDMGLSGSYGFLISLDGYGEGFEISHNTVDGYLDIGIENTGWVDGDISFNTFTNAGPLTSPFTSSDRPMTNVVWEGNRTITPATRHVSLVNISRCTIRDNYVEINGSDATVAQALLLRGATNNNFNMNTWKNVSTVAASGRYAASIEGVTALPITDNIFTDDVFDNSSSPGNFSAVRLVATATDVQNNLFIRPNIIKGTGGNIIDEVSVAGTSANNLCSDLRTALLSAIGSNDYVSVTPATDADVTLSVYQYSSKIIRINTGALTTNRNVIMPTAIITPVTIVNASLYTVTVKTSAGTGVSIATGKTAIVASNGTNITRLTADA